MELFYPSQRKLNGHVINLQILKWTPESRQKATEFKLQIHLRCPGLATAGTSDIDSTDFQSDFRELVRAEGPANISVIM